MNAEEQKALDQLTGTIAAVKRATDEQGGKIAGLETAVKNAEDAMLAVRQAQEAAHRAALESSLGSEDELGAYKVRSQGGHDEMRGVSTEDRRRYALDESKGVGMRLTGHWVEETVGADVIRHWRWGLLDDPNVRSAGQLAAQRAVSLRNILRLHGVKHTPQADHELRSALRQCDTKIFADSTNIGAEWIPTTTVPEIERAVLVPTNLVAMLRRRVMRPGTNKIPKRTGYLRMYKGAVPTADNPASAILSSIGTDSVEIDAVEGVVASQIHRHALADSDINVAAELLAEIVETIRFADDDCMINGDTAATHQDAIASWNTRSRLGSSGLGTTADHRRRALGLRARAYDLTSMTTDQTAAQTFAGARTALGKLGADNLMLGHMTGNNVVWLTSWEYFFAKMLGWDEFASWEKVGALASALTGLVGQPGATPGGMLPGQVGYLHGMVPVCIAYPLTADLAATGLYTGSGSTTGALQFDRSRFEYVVREGATIESAADILNNTQTYVARVRNIPIRSVDAVASTVKDVHFSFNLSSS